MSFGAAAALSLLPPWRVQNAPKRRNEIRFLYLEMTSPLSLFRINPAFERFPVEASLVGRILASFGEIEVSFCRNAAWTLCKGTDPALDRLNTVFKALYSLRATSQRFEVADQLMRPSFTINGFLEDYETSVSAVWHCQTIRNQYAHCNWGDHEKAGLFFADLQKSAETPHFDHTWRHVDPDLLSAQLEYFGFAMELLEWLNHEIAVKDGRLLAHYWPKPSAQTPPPLHNDGGKHVPPWLGEEQKALHLARARAAQGGPPTPTPKQQALDNARAEKHLRKASHQRTSQEGDQRAKERSDPTPDE